MLATVDCYTCRRRRVRCDRALPHCEMCANRPGLDCLGYRKPLVWDKGVASRGKIMGKTFPLPKPLRQRGSVCEAVVRVRKEEDYNGRSSSPESGMGCGGLGVIKRRGLLLLRRGWEWYHSNGSGWGKVVAEREGESGVGGKRDGEGPGVCYVGEGWLRPFSLEFFDLDMIARANIIWIIILQPLLEYRNLLSLAAEHPSPLHAALTAPEEAPSLVYKGRAIISLLQDLQRPNCDGAIIIREPVLAAALLFLFFEALGSGRDTRKIRLQSARRLIQMSGGMGGQDPSLSPEVLTQTHSLSWGSTGTNPEEIFKFLEQTEHYSFLGYPAELLQDSRLQPPTPGGRAPPLHQNAAGTHLVPRCRQTIPPRLRLQVRRTDIRPTSAYALVVTGGAQDGRARQRDHQGSVRFSIKSAGVLLEALWRDGGGDWKEKLARTGSDYFVGSERGRK
ncbi:hypothetical protein C7212DRAFT_357155 [Tuber magnatum]|uniref:Zn(2)-C6 fungal-type domain-containing protein n=1 Tax=Tuber magnatum TaxID=42249 RepID=A0A317SU76_9PEZI|nr:hypothetical protein C7212DRAFT_357155 [Tuber magnatum]